MHSTTKIATIVGLALSASAFAGSAFANEEFRQHEAHVHGHVELNIAQDGNELLMEINAPGADVLGFEHAPQDEQQQQALEQTVARLEDGASLFTLTSGAGCNIVHQSVVNNLAPDGHGDDHEGDHGEFTIEYHYQCDNLDALSSINTQWFSHFPATKSISVNLLTDRAQTALELSASNTEISL